MNNATSSATKLTAIAVLIFTAATLVVVAVTMAVTGSDHAALALNKNDGGKKSGSGIASGNEGVSLPTITIQKQKCQTAGGTSPVTGACIATSTNTVTESGGVIGEP